MYTKFLQKLGQSYKADRIKDGQFGAMMSVSLCNEVSLSTEPYPGLLSLTVVLTGPCYLHTGLSKVRVRE